MVVKHSTMLTAIASVLCLILFSGVPTVDAQDASKPDLTISSIRSSDEGTYQCKLTNTAGSTNSSFITLDVLLSTPPTISVSLQLYQVDQGKPVTIYITVNSATNVSWTRNGSSITPGQNGYKIFTADSPDLIIFNATIYHAGIYILTASNTAGSNKSLPITLSVTAVPVVTVSPKPVTGYVGQSVTINCTITQVTSNSSITIAWYRNNIAISKGSTYTWSDTTAPDVQISNLDALQHQGIYNCTATSSAGTGYDETTLSVIDRPTVSTLSTSITGNAGSNITVQASVNGSHITTIIWSFNGTSLANDGINGRFSWTNRNSTGSVDLMIKNLALSDTGTYICTVRNGAGANELMTRLTVIAPPTISVSQELYQVDEGKPVTIYIIVSSATNVRNVSWTRNGSSITPGQNGYKIFTADSPDLIIYNATIFHAGIYVFTASNTAGSSESIPITLFVTAVPVVTVLPKPVTGYVGQSVIIYCNITQVTSISSITIAWYRNSIAISKGGTYTWSNTTAQDLNISNLNAIQHQGTYRCNATSSAGTGYDETTLIVIDRPTVSAPTTSITGNAGSNITVQASVTGSHITTIIWSFSGTNLTNDGVNDRFSWTNRNSTGPVDLMIRNLVLSDTGTYVCTVHNGAGANELMIRLTVIVQTGASTEDKPSLSQAAIAAIVIGVLFFIQLVIIIVIIIYCCTHGACRKDDTKSKVAPSEKKTDILPRKNIPIFVEKSSGEDRSYRSVASAVSRKHIDLDEMGPNYGFEEKSRYTEQPYWKQRNDMGPIISLLSDDTAQTFQILASGSTAIQDTTYLYEEEDTKKKKRRRKKKRHHHHRHHGGTEQFGDDEPYPEGPPENQIKR